jgi:hypothetical protein
MMIYTLCKFASERLCWHMRMLSHDTCMRANLPAILCIGKRASTSTPEVGLEPTTTRLSRALCRLSHPGRLQNGLAERNVSCGETVAIFVQKPPRTAFRSVFAHLVVRQRACGDMCMQDSPRLTVLILRQSDMCVGVGQILALHSSCACECGNNHNQLTHAASIAVGMLCDATKAHIG